MRGFILAAVTRRTVAPRLSSATGRLACAWCGRPFDQPSGPGRPRRYCRQSCRQRDYEARRRAHELGLSEGELVVTREQLELLKDRLYLLACALDDVQRDLAVDGDDPEAVRRALDSLTEAARSALPGEG